MLDRYWYIFLDIKIAEEYYFQYIHHSKRRIFALNVLSILISCSGVVAWISEYLSPLPASIIVLIAQVISVLQPLYPYGDRAYAATCIYNQTRRLALTAEQTINRVQFGSMEESDLPAAMETLQASYASIEENLASPDLFPRKNRLHKAAEAIASQYLRSHFDLGGWNNE